MTVNSSHLKCPRCDSILLRPSSATHSPTPANTILPLIQTHGSQVPPFVWTIEGMMTFENIGFSRPDASNTKYLLCADCELGPLGCQISDQTFVLAGDRVKV